MGMLFVCWVSKTKNTIPTLRIGDKFTIRHSKSRCASWIVLNFRKFISQSRRSVGAHWRSMGMADLRMGSCGMR